MALRAFSTEDIAAVALPALRHRIVTNFNAEAEGITCDKIIRKLIETIPQNETGSAAEKNVAEFTKA